MKKLALFAVPLALSAAALAQTNLIPPGAKIFIADSTGSSASLLARAPRAQDPKIEYDQAHGFDFYMAAAISEKKVPVVVVTDKAKADYCLEATWEHVKSLGAKSSVLANIEAPLGNGSRVRDYDGAAVRLVDIRTGDVIFAYSVDRNNAPRGRQSMTESVAKHLKLTLSGAANPSSNPVARAALWSVGKGEAGFDF